MKILYATMQFGRGYNQGTERYVSILAGGVRRRGHQAVVLAGDPERRGPELALGEPVDGDASLLYYPTRGWVAVQGLSPERLLPILERERPDVVHLANPAHIGVGVLTAARDSGIATVVTVMDYWWVCPRHTLLRPGIGLCEAGMDWRECAGCAARGHANRFVRALSHVPFVGGPGLRWLLLLRSILRGLPTGEVSRRRRRAEYLRGVLNAADAIIFPSREAREIVGAGLSHQRVHSIPYGLEPRWFERRRTRSTRTGPIAPKELTVGYAGALAEHKGVHLILRALRKLNWTGTRIRLAGAGTDGGYAGQLHRLAEGLDVEFVGQVASQDMPAFFDSIDVLVVPSIWPENLPIVVLEALAAGVPVLASRVGGIVETIADPAHLFDVDSALSLAERLDTWAKQPSNPATHAVSTADQMVDQTIEVYDACLAEAPGRSRGAE